MMRYKLLQVALGALVLTTINCAAKSNKKDDICGKWTGQFAIIQDLSTPATKYLKQLQGSATDVFEYIDRQFSKPQFAVGSFSDKPHEDLGTGDDICYETNLGFSTDEDAVVNAIKALKARDGGDEPGSQLDAILKATASLSWIFSPVVKSGNLVLRVLVVITSTSFHTSDDKAKSKKLDKIEGNKAPDCTTHKYPTVDQLKKHIREKGVEPLFIVIDKAGSTKLKKSYEKLLKDIDFGGAVKALQEPSVDVGKAINEGVKEIACKTWKDLKRKTIIIIISVVVPLVIIVAIVVTVLIVKIVKKKGRKVKEFQNHQ